MGGGHCMPMKNVRGKIIYGTRYRYYTYGVYIIRTALYTVRSIYSVNHIHTYYVLFNNIKVIIVKV